MPGNQNCRLSGNVSCWASTSTAYYKPVAPSNDELSLLKTVDKLHLKYPFMGSRKIRDQLRAQGIVVNRKRVRRLMRKLGIEAIYPSKRTTIPGKGHKIYPYLLRNIDVTYPNQVWCTDITYIPMAKGFLYLVAIMDWYSRKVLSWQLSNTMDVSFCKEALEEAIQRYRKPEIFNSDQGSQFTSEAFTQVLRDNGIAISMDGKGRRMDNVFIERLWRSLKYEEVYLRAYQNVSEAELEIGSYLVFYNEERTHQGLNGWTPDEAYHCEIKYAA